MQKNNKNVRSARTSIDKLEPQRVARLQSAHIVRLPRVVRPDVIPRREGHPFERVVLEGVVERVIVLKEVAAHRAVGRVGERLVALPLGLARAKLVAEEEGRHAALAGVTHANLLRVSALTRCETACGIGSVRGPPRIDAWKKLDGFIGFLRAESVDDPKPMV